MPDYLATVTLTHKSGFAEDSFVNTFAIRRPTVIGTTPSLGDISTALANFYNGSDAGTSPLSSLLGPGISRAPSACPIRIYDITGKLDGSPHGSPIFVDAMTLGLNEQSSAMPEETSLVLTTRGLNWEQAAVESADGPDAGTAVDRPRQRRSGRIYVGPFTGQAMSVVDSKARPGQITQDAVLTSGVRLKLALRDRASGPYRWSVWSRKDAQLYEIEDVQVDNAWDTQRRRGPDPTVRVTAPVAL
jgi:hypothetical protein